MKKYQVDNDKMKNYIKSLDKHRIFVFVIVTLIILTMQFIIAYKLDNEFPFWLIIIATVIISVAFYFGLNQVNDKLKQTSNGQYFIDHQTLKFETIDSLTREFKLEEIAVIHKKYSGTMIVKGNVWTKFNYFRPKKTSLYQIGGLDIIFIPTITSNYTDLVDNIKQAAPNAMKL